MDIKITDKAREMLLETNKGNDKPLRIYLAGYG